MNKRTKALDISDTERKLVIERQNGKSISGLSLQVYGCEIHHFVSRGCEGVGYEFNLVALTPEEHRAVHDHQPVKLNGRVRYTYQEFQTLIRNHLIRNYVNWTYEGCKYNKKYETKNDYGIYRRKR